MKKVLFLILFAMPFVNELNAAEKLLTNMQLYSWYGSDWKISYKYLYYYDENDNIIKSETFQNIDDTLIPYQIIHSQYNSDNKVSHVIVQEYNKDDYSFDTIAVQDYSYNADGNVQEINGNIFELGNTEGRIVYDYDENGYRVEEIYQIVQDGQLTNERRYTYEYDDIGNKTLIINMEWTDGQWQGTKRIERTCEGNNETNRKHYAPEGSEWRLVIEVNNSYDEYGQLAETYAITSNNYESKNIYSYTVNSEDYERRMEGFKLVDGEWVKLSASDQIFYSDSTQKETISYGVNDNEWINSRKTVYIYDNQSAVEGDFLSDVLSIRCYPNPVKGMCNIQYYINFNSFVEIEILDESGKILKSFVQGNQAPGDYNISVGLEEFSSGAYFYRLMTNGVPLTRQMLLVK